MAAEPPRNSFRASVLRGERTPLLVTDKAPQQDHSREELQGFVVKRAESRHGDHRDKNRHRLTGETAIARYKGKAHKVELVNLSAGGAMIRARFAPRLWDIVELELGEGHGIECAVRWLKKGLVGLEFAHETRIDCDAHQRAALLLEVIQRSFPDAPVQLEPVDEPEEPEPVVEEGLGNRGETRHPLIWMGEIHYAFDSNPVRLRNISSGGTLVDAVTTYPVGAEVTLDLGEAGQFQAIVSWSRGDQAGLKFTQPIDLACLAKARPQVAEHRWLKIDFGQCAEDSTPWDEQWSRSSIDEIRAQLESYLKR